MNNYYKNSMNYLEKKFNILSFPVSVFPSFHIEHLKNNALINPLNEIYNIKKEDLKFKSFYITELESNNVYLSATQSNFFELPLSIKDNKIELYVVLEETIGCVESNSDRLFCELLLAMKPTEKDMSNQHVSTMFENIDRTIKEHYP